LGIELTKEVSLVHKLAPSIVISQPTGKPNTLSALQLISYVKSIDTIKAENLKNEIYKAYWVNLQDISNPEVLRKIANDIGTQSIKITENHKLTAKNWQLSWESRNIQCVPAIQNTNGQLLLGLTTIEQLNEFTDHG